MRVVFWNVGAKGRTRVSETTRDELAHEVLRELDAAVLLLAEATDGLTTRLLDAGFSEAVPESGRVLVFVREGVRCRSPIADASGHYVGLRLATDEGEVNLFGVHLRSARSRERDARNDACVHLRKVFVETFEREHDATTILVGDFNLDPWERGVVHGSHLNSISDRRIAKERKARTVDGRRERFFVNLGWSLGNRGPEAPFGSYAFNGSEPDHGYWHQFDHVHARPEALERILPGSVQHVLQVGERALVDRHGRPVDPFDHLPVSFELK